MNQNKFTEEFAKKKLQNITKISLIQLFKLKKCHYNISKYVKWLF